MPVGPGAVLDALEAVQTRRRRHARGFLLDAACGVREAARAFAAVRSGLPHVLPPARLPREADRGDAAAGAAARGREAASPARSASQEALFAGHGRERARSRREVEIDARLTVSDREMLQKKDFAQMTAAEIAAAKDAISGWCCRSTRSRRGGWRPHRHGHRRRSAPHAARQHEGRRRGDRSEISRAAHASRRRSWRCSISPAR